MPHDHIVPDIYGSLILSMFYGISGPGVKLRVLFKQPVPRPIIRSMEVHQLCNGHSSLACDPASSKVFNVRLIHASNNEAFQSFDDAQQLIAGRDETNDKIR